MILNHHTRTVGGSSSVARELLPFKLGAATASSGAAPSYRKRVPPEGSS